MNIKESMDVLSLVKVFAEKIEKVAPGGVSLVEIIAEMPALVAPIYSAIEGIEKIPSEMHDLDSDEAKALALASIDAVMPLIRMLKAMK